MAQTNRKLGKLAKEKMEEAEVDIKKKLLPKDLSLDEGGLENNVNKNKKTVVNLKFGDDDFQENCLRQLLLDLDSVCSLFQGFSDLVRCCFGCRDLLKSVICKNITTSVICDVMKSLFRRRS